MRNDNSCSDLQGATPLHLSYSNDSKVSLFKSFWGICFMMMVFSLIKSVFLYHGTLENQETSMVVLRSIPALVMLYGILYFLPARFKFTAAFVLHCAIAFVLFSDLVYFQYFNTLPSVYDLRQTKELPGVWDSVQTMLKPIYFLMFIDLLPILYLRTKFNGLNPIKPSMKYTGAAVFIVMAVISTANITLIKAEDNFYTYERYGVFSYHIKDILRGFQRRPEADLNEHIALPNLKNMKKNPKFFGAAKGRNLIVVQFEALQDFVVHNQYNGQEITPNLNMLIKKDSIYFDRYYYTVNKGNTSDAEFAVLNSLFPTTDTPTYKKYYNNTYYSLPALLRENGYSVKAFHGYKRTFWNRNVMYPTLGFEDYISLERYKSDEIIGLGLSDESFYRQTIPYIKKMKQPFFAFVITLTSHNPFTMPQKHQKLKLEEKHKNTLFGSYLQSIHYADMALGKFMEDLKREGLYQNSIIALYGDHFGLYHKTGDNQKIVSDYLGYDYNFVESMNVPFMIHIPDKGITEKKSIVGSHLDVYPTLINLLGFENKKVRMFGQDLLNTDKGFVAIRNFLNKGSFIDDEKMFIMPSNCKFSEGTALSLQTRKPTGIEGCRSGYERALKDINESEYILSNDLIKEVLQELKK